jgi:glycosyltransferase involved in cell wall biosynthesis
MKIAWFTPFTKKSAIGKYSKLATDSLSEVCTVDIWTHHTDDLWETSTNIINFNLFDEGKLNKLIDYDVIIYNMGNYTAFHFEIYEVSKKFRGIVILHDFVMHHFFTGYYFVNKNDPSLYIDAIRILYGNEAGHLAAQSIHGNIQPPVWETDEVVKYAFIEKTVENALGVITHSHFHRRKVAEKFSGPISTINFPFTTTEINEVTSTRSDQIVKLLTVGHVNPNKRIDRVIEAIGQDQYIKERVQYTIIGPYHNNEYFSQIKLLIKKYDLENKVHFLGYQSEENLILNMNETDIYVNLRYPTYEGASWSLLEEAAQGKPIIATNSGFYSEFPDDSILKIDMENEIMNIRASLKKLIDDPELRINFGEKIKNHIQNYFTGENYRDSFMKLANLSMAQKPLMDSAGRIGNEFSNLGINQDSKVFSKIVDELLMLFK